jgi:RNA polymerase subunit RPABC4/transcription elongation factor Spt4
MAKKSMDIGEFMKDTKPRVSDIESLDLKESGKAIVWLHPSSGIFKRDTHYFPVYATVIEDNKRIKKVYMAMIIHEDVKSCLICQLRKALRDNEDIDMDEIILRVGEDSDEVEYSKGEIIGAEGYGWKKNLSYKTEYLFGVVNNAKPEKVLKLTAPKSLGKKITKVIEDQIEEEGEEEGNPFKKPYAFKLSYDKDADQPSNMYDAVWNKAECTDEITELLEGEGLDLSVLTEVTSEAKVAYIIREALVYDVDELGLDLSVADEFDPKELDRIGNSNEEKVAIDTDDKKKEEKSVKKEEKTVKKEEKTVKKEEKSVKKEERPVKKEEKKEEKPVSNKKVLKPKAKPQVECPSCGKMIDEDATKCPYCEAEFEEEEMIECPSCGKDIPADSKVCPSCGEDVNPF